MALMTNRRIRHDPVVENDGRLYGIVSIGGVVKHRLDEIRGEAEAMWEYISGSRWSRSRCNSFFRAVGTAAGEMAMTTGKSFDYQQALDDPCRICGQPGNVLTHADLDARQKREI